ncbi:MAG TPA: methyltransferase domain-containing protein [Candidatus Acidoferrum sp.]|nr:methyltransferase domain-containing protein [Candidatus Acidoferrum sp.]
MRQDTYNDRLFHGNRARRFLHERRFWWLVDRLQRLKIGRADIIEIGCYDGKTVSYLERSGIAVNRYVGYEADDEVAIPAQELWVNRAEISIVRSKSPTDIDESAKFDVGICMETLEHLPDELVDSYLEVLARIVRGPVFFTIPVERGAMLVAKQLGYRIFGMYGERLSWRDIVAGALSQTDRIPRHEHRGFDDRQMVERIARYFRVEESGGLFVPYLTTLNFTVGVIGDPKS